MDHGFAHTARRGVRLDAIGEGWALFKEQWGTWVLTGLIVVIGHGAVVGFVFSLLGEKAPIGPGGFRFDVPPSSKLLEALLTTIVTGFSLGGMFRMACLQVRGNRVHVRELFGITDVLSELALGSALLTLALSVAAALCALPAFIVAGLLMFTIPLIVDARMKGTDAIVRSFQALKGQWLNATIFHLFASLLAGAGVLCCFVGIYLTLPLYCLSVAVRYRDFFLSKSEEGLDKPTTGDPYFSGQPMPGPWTLRAILRPFLSTIHERRRPLALGNVPPPC
jgi:hypothetical protein